MKILLGFVASVVVLGLVVFGILKYGGTEMSSQESPTTKNPAPSAATTKLPMQATVTYTDEGFSPTQVEIAKGGTIEFVNKSTIPLWVASDPHPEHTDYPEFDAFKILGDRYPEPGQNIKFTFQKVGSWTYHSHAASGDASNVTVHPGTIIVKE